MAAVEIYTIRYCPYCQEAKELLSRKGGKPHEMNITGDRQMRTANDRARERTQHLPQIFIGATHVGGCDDLYELDAAGKLDALLGGRQRNSRHERGAGPRPSKPASFRCAPGSIGTPISPSC